MNKTAWIILGGVFGSTVLVVLLTTGMVISANNYGVTAEQGVIATYDNNKNILSNYGKKVVEATQVPAMYADDLTKLVKAQIEGRYGPNGSQANMQWLKEAAIPLGPSLYKQIQQIIEAGRNDFKVGQTELLDKKRAYKTELGKFPRSMFMSLLGFPKIDLTKYDIVTDARVETSFDTKREEAIQLRPTTK